MVMVPAYFVHYGQPYNSQLVPVDMVPLVTFEMMLPMCCTGYVEILKQALFGLGELRDVFVDLHNQHVTIAGHVDPLQALNRMRSVGATLSPRHLMQQINRPGGVLYAETRYTRTNCPVYTPGGSDETHYASVNPTIATYVREA